MKRWLFFLFFIPVLLPASPLYSPTWGFKLDLPEGYQYVNGNNLDRYSFQGPNGAMFDIAVYNGSYSDIGQMTQDVNRRIQNKGDTAFFDYVDKDAALLELRFGNYTGWGIGVELDAGDGKKAPLLLALAYAPAAGVEVFHLSALDSIIPSAALMHQPGPITEFSYPRGGLREAAIAGTALTAVFGEHDAEAAQALVDREFALLRHYQTAPNWQEAWTRYYRMICRDSRARVADAAFRLVQSMHTAAGDEAGKLAFAEKALAWVQGFIYERDPEGSDFVNLVTAVTEGRGDCDSRSMLWAIVLLQADIPAAMMISHNHSHAMGLAGVSGAGARFQAGGINWLVAETTDKVGIGLISADMSDIKSWLAVLFE